MKNARIGLFLIAAVVVVLALVMSGLFSILPELDNRINYWDKIIDDTQAVLVSDGTTKIYETSKFEYSLEGTAVVSFANDFINAYTGTGCDDGSGTATITAKKDFSRLNTFIRLRLLTSELYISNVQIPISGNVYHNIEIKPDNLNIGIYDVFVDGTYFQRLNIPDDKVFIKFQLPRAGGCRTDVQLNVDYIKYVPLETFSIKNDEVWVKEVRGSDYSVNDLNWEMIGYHSDIRSATIRDLAQQIEVPAPQIYVNLINGKAVSVAPNTVHTFYYKTKWTSGLDSSCRGDLDKVQIKIDDKWICESFVKETPIIQQCQIKSDCPILPDCEVQKDLISCNNNLCDYVQFSPACKNQLITFQEKVTEIENTKFVPLPSGTNSFYCFFDKDKSSCNVGEKKLSATAPQNICAVTDSSQIISDSSCFKTTVFFDGNPYNVVSGTEINAVYNIKLMPSIGAVYSNNNFRDNWGIVVKGTLPDNFLEIKAKDLGNKFVLQNSEDKVAFTIVNNLGFGIDGGYTLMTTNTALQGGVVLRDEIMPLFLKNGDNEVNYNFKTEQLGSIIDLIGVFGKVTTDREYIMKSSSNNQQRFLIVSKEVIDILPDDIEKVQPKTILIDIPITKKCGFFCQLWEFIKNLF